MIVAICCKLKQMIAMKNESAEQKQVKNMMLQTHSKLHMGWLKWPVSNTQILYSTNSFMTKETRSHW